MSEDTDAGPAEKPVPRFFSGRAFGAERPKKTGNFRFYEQFHFMFHFRNNKYFAYCTNITQYYFTTIQI